MWRRFRATERESHQVELPVTKASELSRDVQQQVEQGVEDNQPAPKRGHWQLQQPLKGLKVPQLIEGSIAVDNGRRDVLLGDYETKHGDHYQLGHPPAADQGMCGVSQQAKDQWMCGVS